MQLKDPINILLLEYGSSTPLGVEDFFRNWVRIVDDKVPNQVNITVVHCTRKGLRRSCRLNKKLLKLGRLKSTTYENCIPGPVSEIDYIGSDSAQIDTTFTYGSKK